MTDTRKQVAVRVLTLITILSGAWSFLAIAVSGSGWVIPAWWQSWALAAFAVLSGVAAVMSWKTPRQVVPLLVNAAVLVGHLIHWGRFSIWLIRG